MHASLESEARAAGPTKSVSEAHELRKLIIKLRWIGMESEAENLSHRLAEIAPQACAFGEPRETD